jgi:hypothetical protein
MTPKQRRPTPQGTKTGPARQKAHEALQRRLRLTLAQVEWRDAIAGALLGQFIDALGGSDAANMLLELVAALLP